MGGLQQQLLLGVVLLLLTTVVTLDGAGVVKNTKRQIGGYCENDASTECEIPLVCRNFECKCESKKCSCDLLEIWQNGKCRNRAETRCTVKTDPKDDNCVEGAKCISFTTSKGGSSGGICECTKSTDVRDGLCNSGYSFRHLDSAHFKITFIVLVLLKMFG